jgi:phospholipid-binding lipoprotein MlaA
VVVLVALGGSMAGCGGLSHATRSDVALALEAPPRVDPSAPAPPIEGREPAPTATADPVGGAATVLDAIDPGLMPSGGEEDGPALPGGVGGSWLLAQAPGVQPGLLGDDFEEEYDPWEPFNERMFEFNRSVDRWVLKPVARGYRVVVPEQFQLMIENGFDNLRVVPRVVNSLLQGKFEGALRDLSRFVLNSTLGVGGLFDAGRHAGLEPSREDFGQTLGVYGVGAGPYLVLPLLPPMTVRDGIGRAVDGAMDPLAYVVPFVWTRIGMKAGETVNERALNYDLFEGVEETTLDLYSSVRHFYLKRREQQIRE